MKHLQYLSYVLRHKWYVFIECCRLGIPWAGLTHDLSKFRPSEWFAYVDSFYGGPWSSVHGYYGDARNRPIKYKEDVQRAFDRAWLLHQRRNPHHWQAWILTEDEPDTSRYLVQEDGQGYSPIWLFNTETKSVAATFPFEHGNWEQSQVAHLVAKAYARFLSTKVLEMPLCYRKEMLADWRGCGKALGKPDTKAWYEDHKHKMVFGPETRAWIERNLQDNDVPVLVNWRIVP